MQITNILLAVAFAVGTMLSIMAHSTHAALPCSLNDQIVSTEFADEPNRDPSTKSLVHAFKGVQPANRTGATEIDSDSSDLLRFGVVSEAENILRCLNYGQDEVLVLNSTPRYRMATFGVQDGVPEMDIISDLRESGVYTERVENPLELRDGNYLVDFTARHNGLWMSGEMVFEEYGGDLYLNATWLENVAPADGESHSVTYTDDGVSPEALTVRNGDTIGFGNERSENIRIVVTSTETGDIVFRGGNLGKNFAGPAPKYVFYVQNLDPGTYTATVTTTDSGEAIEVAITVEP